MEKLDKVIAALELHRSIGDGEPCRECPYEEYEIYCLTVLERDALELLKEYRELIWKHKLVKDGRLELARRCRELEDKLSWLETKPAPNDWGEYPPEFPREGM